MAIEIINLGTVLLDGEDGDVARIAFEKVNANFAEHETEIDAIIPRVTTVENDVGQLEIQAGEVEGSLTNLTESFNILSTEVGTNTSDIQNLENFTAGLSSSLTALDEEVDMVVPRVLNLEITREYILTPGTNITIDRNSPTSPVISADIASIESSKVSYTSSSGLSGSSVEQALNALGRAGKDGIFSTPAELGHRVGQITYCLNAAGGYSLLTPFKNYFPFGMEIGDGGLTIPGKKAYYVSLTGLLTNDGLTWATSLPSIATAMSKTDVDIVYVAAGVYMDEVHQGVAGQHMRVYAGSRDIAVIAVGGRVSMLNAPIQSTAAWSTTGAPNVYSKTVPSADNTSGVVALTHTDKYGLPLMLKEVADTAAVSATPGSWCRLPAAIYVRMPDNSVPSPSLVRYTSNSIMRVTSPSSKVYFRGLDFIGGTTSCLVCTGGNSNSVVISRDCRFVGAATGNSYSVESVGLSILIDCMAGASGNDGFNYHALNGVTPHFIEVNCVGVGAKAAGTGNGSTSHEMCVGFRIGCNYAENAGPGVADVNDAKTYNVSVSSNNNGPTVTAGGFTSQADASVQEGALIWLHRCSAFGNPGGDLRARFNGRIRVRDCQVVLTSSSEGGSITPF